MCAGRYEIPALEDALESTDPERIKSLILSFCEVSDQALKYFTKSLLVAVGEDESGQSKREPLKRTHSLVDEKPSPSKLDAAATQNKKNKYTSRYEVCIQCKKHYDTVSNMKTSCVWHPGQLRCFGHIDSVGKL